jgi:hypothetical protein
VGIFAQQNVLLKDLFLICYFAVVLNLVYEATKLGVHASHKGFFVLVNPDYIRKVLRGLIFTGLGLGAYGVLIVNANVDGQNNYPIQWYPNAFYEVAGRPFEFFRVDPDYDAAVQAGMDPAEAADALPQVQELKEAEATANSSGIDFGDDWVAILTKNNLTPEVLLAAMNERITDATGKMDAWNFVRGLQDAATTSLANMAAEKVWNDLSATGAPSDGGGTTDALDNKADTKAGVLALLSNYVGLIGRLIGTALAAVGYTAAYFAMDLVICKVLWMNAIYLALSYRVALIMLPTALVLGYFPATASVINGIGKHIIVCVMAFRLYGMAVTTLINPSFIKDTVIQNITLSPDAVTKDDAIYIFAKKVFIEQQHADGGKTMTKPMFIAAVRTKLQNSPLDMLGQTGFNQRSTYPFIGLVMLAFLVSLVGKIMTILQDSLNGQMTYHRG